MPAFDSSLYMCDFSPCRRIMARSEVVLSIAIMPDASWSVFAFCSPLCLGRAAGKRSLCEGSRIA